MRILQVASLVAVLKVARQLNLVRDLDRVTVPGHDPVHIPEALLRRAVEHGNDTLLVDAMALVCSHPKSTAVPGMHHAPLPLLDTRLFQEQWCRMLAAGYQLQQLYQTLPHARNLHRAFWVSASHQ